MSLWCAMSNETGRPNFLGVCGNRRRLPRPRENLWILYLKMASFAASVSFDGDARKIVIAAFKAKACTYLRGQSHRSRGRDHKNLGSKLWQAHRLVPGCQLTFTTELKSANNVFIVTTVFANVAALVTPAWTLMWNYDEWHRCTAAVYGSRRCRCCH